MKNKINFKIISLTLLWIWFVLFALIPFLLIIFTSFLSHDTAHLIMMPFTLSNYKTIFTPLYFSVFEKSFILAVLCTFFCLIISYPFAFILAKANVSLRSLLLVLVIIPFWTSSVIRTYAMMAILKAKGILNTMLIALGIIHMPLNILYTNIAVMLGLVYNLLPFMILPLYANIERLDDNLVEAAKDLGANRIRVLHKIIVPLTMPGIIAGSILVFLPAMTLFYIPDILGGAKSMLLGNLIQNQFLFAENWPVGSAVSVILTALMAIMLWFYWRKTSVKERNLIV